MRFVQLATQVASVVLGVFIATFLVVGLLLAIFVFDKDEDADGTPSEAVAFRVIVARYPMGGGTTISSKSIELKTVTEDEAAEGYVTDPAALIGRAVIRDFAAGEPVVLRDTADGGPDCATIASIWCV